MSEQGEKNLLAGHAPATIVGGMRVPGHHHKSQDINNNNNKTNESKTESEESFNQDQIAERRTSSGNTVAVNGVEIKLNEAYPTESVKRTHEKPIPTHDKIHNRPNPPHHSGGIFQPRTGHQN